jgi:poly-gamma-glutamate capsule biosynthesis protein CapA/YwtB (metallophosphatase superfamily)
MAGNLEGTLSTGGVSKCGPAPSPVCFAFQAPPGNAAGLADAGFDVLNVANNHAYDFGADGQAQTLAALDAAGLAATGTPGAVTVRRAGGRTVAFVGFATYPWAPSLADPAAVHDLVGTAAARADHVVVLFHGGAEGTDRTHVPPGPEAYLGEDRGDLRAFARAAIDAGADAVLGSGPHVLRGMEVYRDRLIAYSLGNFAGVRNFATSGTLALSAILELELDRRGRFAGGRLRPVRLDAGGRPDPDPAGEAVALVRDLSLADFGARAPRISAGGRLLPPPQR